MADFGLTEETYGTNYYRRDTVAKSDEKVPIRWMAPESIENDIYTESTDVVSVYRHTVKSVCICCGKTSIISNDVCIIIVGIWCDMLGAVHMWESALLWNPCHESSQGTAHWPKAGEAKQHCLLR